MRAMGTVSAIACLLAALAAAGPARAETREVAGETFVLNDTMGSDAVISIDPTLAGRVRVSLDGSLSCLSVTGGEAAVITTSGCPDDSGTLRIDVPADMPLTLTGNGDGNMRIADTRAPLILTMNGSGNVVGGSVGRLVLSIHGSSDATFSAVLGGATLEMAGSGDVRLASVSGELVLKHHGSGDLAVGHVEAAVVSVESTGSGDMLVGAGHVATLAAHMQGNGALIVAAPVHDVDISAFGGGDVKLGVVTGAIHRSSGDGSDIVIGGPGAVDDLIGKVAQAVGTAQDRTSHSASGSHHFLTFVVVAVVAYIVWRMVRRGGLRAASGPASGTVHPGVAAVMETLGRTEARLGRVEGYVTSREFDLQQKFKNL